MKALVHGEVPRAGTGNGTVLDQTGGAITVKLAKMKVRQPYMMD